MIKKIVLIQMFLLIPSIAFAGGFVIPDIGTTALGRGGAFVAKADDPSAIYYNPAGLTKLRGWKIMLDSNLVFKHFSFTRAPADGITYPRVTDKLTPFPGPIFVVTTNFGLKDWTFAVGVYGPSAVGKASYPDDPGLKYPAVAPQKFELLSMDTMMAFYTLSVAWKPTDKFSFGVSLQWADMWYTKINVWVNTFTSPHTTDVSTWPDKNYDAIAHLNMKDHFAFTMIFGMMFRPDPALEVGIAFRPIPVKFHAKGSFNVSYPTKYLHHLEANGGISLPTNNVSMDIELPIYVRMGTRYIYRRHKREVFDIEFDTVYENWSTTKAFNIDLDAKMKMNNGTYPLNSMSIPKNYSDTWSFRLGGDYNVIQDKLWIRAGAFFETGANPRNTTYLDFASYNRIGVSTGLTWKIGAFDIKVAYEHVFQPTRNIGVDETKIYENMPLSPCTAPYTSGDCHPQGHPPGPSVGGGEYKSGFDIVSAGVTFNFDRL